MVYCPTAEKGVLPAIPRALLPPFSIQKPMIATSPMVAETGTPKKSRTTNRTMVIVPTVTGWIWALIAIKIAARKRTITRATMKTRIARETILKPETFCHKGLAMSCCISRNPSKPDPRVMTR